MLGRRLSALAGLTRSVWIYRLDAAHRRAMDQLYRRFVPPGGLAFDVGAHVGDRVACFLRLGANVVAVEPQPGPMAVLRLAHGRDRRVALVRTAVLDSAGTVKLAVNTANPTVSTVSREFIAAASGAPGWAEQAWDDEIVVDAVTLDDLIARFGAPAFVKIDVEGCEDRVLAGLSTPLPALSFEFTTIQRQVASRCLERLVRLGPYRFDVALGENQRLEFGRFVDAETMVAYLKGLPQAANSGDVFALNGDIAG